MDADIGAVEPLALRLVRRQPAALDDLAEGVIDVLEVEVEPQRRGGADHAIALQHDELSVLEQLHVLEVVLALETLLVGQGREAAPLEFFHLDSELRARLHQDDTFFELAVIPLHGSSKGWLFGV